MADTELTYKTKEDLLEQIRELRRQLEEANDTIEAIRTGQIDALVVDSDNGPQLYTLKSADQTYRVFIEQMTEGAVTLSKQGLILYGNSQFAHMVQLPLSNVIGIPFIEFVAPENHKHFRKLFEQCWASDTKGEILLVAGEGRTPVQLSLTTLELEEGVSLSIILTDLTTQKATQKQLKRNYEQLEEINQALEASNQDLQQVASVASHDLQEPLRKILIFSSLIKENEIELAPQSKQYLDKIIVSSSRMKKLIIDILNYSRLSASKHQIESVDLNELVTELLDDFEMMIQEKEAKIVRGMLPSINVNRGQIRQVLQNIISNALKFSRQGVAPVISIAAKSILEKSFDSREEKNGPFCLITITDNGIGFDEKYVANIFTLFERLNSKHKFEGTGIGLAIAKKIIDKHNGLITATSKEGTGTEFRIVLPFQQKAY